MMLLDTLAIAFALSPLAAALLVLTVAFGLGIVVGKLYVGHIERTLGRHR